MASPFTPVVFYRDPMAALRWLEKAFGFETSMLVTDAEGKVGHAEMKLGDGRIGVGAVQRSLQVHHVHAGRELT